MQKKVNFALPFLSLYTGVCIAVPKKMVSSPAKLKSAVMSKDQVRTAIEHNEIRYGQAMQRGDVAGYANLFAPDATVLRGNLVMKGRTNLVQAFKKSPRFKSVQFTIKEVDVSGNLAYEVGNYTVTLASGKVNTGNYVEIWKHQQDGSWKIQVEATVPHQ